MNKTISENTVDPINLNEEYKDIQDVNNDLVMDYISSNRSSGRFSFIGKVRGEEATIRIENSTRNVESVLECQIPSLVLIKPSEEKIQAEDVVKGIRALERVKGMVRTSSLSRFWSKNTRSKARSTGIYLKLEITGLLERIETEYYTFSFLTHFFCAGDNYMFISPLSLIAMILPYVSLLRSYCSAPLNFSNFVVVLHVKHRIVVR